MANPIIIGSLANLLRCSGDKIINGEIKFSLTGQMLRALNDSFSLFVSDQGRSSPTSSSFVVCALPSESKSTVFGDLQLIYDFVQITFHLSICQLITDDEIEGTIDVTNFRNLHRLEVQKLPIHKITGLIKLRKQLKSVICNRCLKSIKDLILSCGGDQSNGDFWTELTSAHFANNGLRFVDNSLELAPSLQSLNLSHNLLTETSLEGLRCLPNLKYLDLSFNRLTQIPFLHRDASTKLQELNVKNNFIENINQIADLASLTVLDLSGNCLLDHISLMPISTLASLRFLSLLNNPIAFHPKHRQTTVTYLHSNTSTVKFNLNHQPMTKHEKGTTGAFRSYHVIGNGDPSDLSKSSLTSSIVSLQESTDTMKSEKSEAIVEISTKKRLRVRKIVLSDEVATPAIKSSGQLSNSFNERSMEHLETKKQIEELRREQGENWLKSNKSNIVSEVFPKTEQTDELVRQKILMDLQEDSIEIVAEDDFTHSTPYNNNSGQSRLKGDQSQAMDETTYKSVAEPDLDEFYSVRMSTSIESVEEDNEVIYGVQKLRDAKSESGTKYLLVVSDSSIREKDPKTRATVNRWNLTILESCEMSKTNVISIEFDTLQKDRKQRVYLIEDADCQKLTQFLRDYLSNRVMDQVLYQCAKCNIQFCKDRNTTKKVKCPECLGTYLIELREKKEVIDRAEIVKPVFEKPSTSTNKPVAKAPSTEASPIRKSTSNSSIGSATSLNESSSCSKITGEGSADSNQSVAGSSTSQRDKDADLNSKRLGMDSDVEILSNPSQSSIEVLDSRNSSRKHSEERRILLATNFDVLKVNPDNVVEAKEVVEKGIEVGLKDNLRNIFLNLTESSSSGSVTDSICTAYEQPAEVEEHKSFQKQAAPVEVQEDKKSSNIFEGLLKTFTSNKMDGIKVKAVDPFVFSTTTFHQMDHRLQIYLYQNVFVESNEKFNCVIRCRFFDDLMKCCRSAEDAIIVMSNKKVYVFFVVGEEEDDPQQWIRLVTRVNLSELSTIVILPYHIGIRCTFNNKSSNGEWNLITKDRVHCQNFIGFLRKNFKNKIEDFPIDNHREKLNKCVENEDILILALVKNFTKRVDDQTDVVEFGYMIVTPTKFHVISPDVKWLVEKRADLPEKLFELALKDMVECQVKSDTEFVLNFLDESENQYKLWCLEFETKPGADAVLEAIKEPWENLFDAPLIQDQ